MFQLDEKFLQDIGLGELPEAQRKPFLQHIYDQLEYQVGLKLSDGLSDDQIAEFEAIIDKKPEVIDAWVAQHAPNYQQEPVFQSIIQGSGLPADSAEAKAEYAATKWLEVNRPDYRDTVMKTLEDLKQEIIKNKDAIVGSQQ